MSMALRRGEMVGLIGPNGAGKTTLFNLIAGALKPTSGEIRIADIEVSSEGPEKRIGRGVGRTFQIPRPFPEMTVLENVLTGAQNQSGERFWMNFVRAGRVVAEERAAVDKARALLDFVHSGETAERTRAGFVGRPAQASRTGAHPDGRPGGNPA